MFKKFIERAAAKASLINIKFDLDQLAESFPDSVPRASNAIFKLLENITLAFSNNASDAEVRQVLVAKSARYPGVLREIIDSAYFKPRFVFYVVDNRRVNSDVGGCGRIG